MSRFWPSLIDLTTPPQFRPKLPTLGLTPRKGRTTSYHLISKDIEMLNMKNHIEIQCAVTDPTWAASMLATQCAALPTAICLSPEALFLNDSRPLGYAYGFAGQASRHIHGVRHDEIGREYIESVFVSLLKDGSRAKALLLYANLQQDDIRFQKGSDLGVMDLNDWILSRGRAQPRGLIELYELVETQPRVTMLHGSQLG